MVVVVEGGVESRTAASFSPPSSSISLPSPLPLLFFYRSLMLMLSIET